MLSSRIRKNGDYYESSINYEAMSARNKFQKNHPKFVAFLNRCFAGGLKEGTIIEITVTNPGEAPITSNIKVQQSDLELLEELKEMGR